LIVTLLSLRANERLGALQQFLYSHFNATTSSNGGSSSMASSNSGRRQLRRMSNAGERSEDDQMSVSETSDGRRSFTEPERPASATGSGSSASVAAKKRLSTSYVKEVSYRWLPLIRNHQR
jgi:hypothetical protein